VIDSIQNCSLSAQGRSLANSQLLLREAAQLLMEVAKKNNIAIILTGHVTKEGIAAGPRLLEHLVDGVFYLQSDEHSQHKVFRAVKNRFGPTDEVGFFQMLPVGLQEVQNFNEKMLAGLEQGVPGSVLTVAQKGSRTLFLELQALCVQTKFPMPQRVVTGIDQKRVVIIAAILEKCLNVKMSSCDIFFKVCGGIKVVESSIDLAIALALLSSYYRKPLASLSLAIGEIGLTGRVKFSSQVASVSKGLEKIGISNLIIGASVLDEAGKSLKKMKNIIEIKTVFDLVSLFA
jgi:DNA repair protein RadA/Sms